MVLTQSGITASCFSAPLSVTGTSIISTLIIYSIPLANVLSSISPAAHHPALFLTHSGIETTLETGTVELEVDAPAEPTSKTCCPG